MQPPRWNVPHITDWEWDEVTFPVNLKLSPGTLASAIYQFSIIKQEKTVAVKERSQSSSPIMQQIAEFSRYLFCPRNQFSVIAFLSSKENYHFQFLKYFLEKRPWSQLKYYFLVLLPFFTFSLKPQSQDEGISPIEKLSSFILITNLDKCLWFLIISSCLVILPKILVSLVWSVPWALEFFKSTQQTLRF